MPRNSHFVLGKERPPGDTRLSPNVFRTDQTRVISLKNKVKYERFSNRLRLLKKAKTESTVQPIGTLVIHIRTLRLDGIDIYELIQRYDASVYIRILVNRQIKYTVMYRRVKMPAILLFDELKHFRLEISDTRNDVSNFVHIEVVLHNPVTKDVHKVVTTVDVHLHDIVGSLCDDRLLELRDVNDQQRIIGNLQTSLCFAYGIFGYGYSNQLDNSKKTASENLLHSIFYRPLPPPSRESLDDDVMICRHIGHPDFIYFNGCAALDIYHDFHQDFNWFCDVHELKPKFLNNKISDRIHLLATECQQLTTRRERLDFLKSWITNSEAHVPCGQNMFQLKPGFVVKHRNLIPVVPDGQVLTSTEENEIQRKPHAKTENSSGQLINTYGHTCVSVLGTWVTAFVQFLRRVGNIRKVFCVSETDSLTEQHLEENEETNYPMRKLRSKFSKSSNNSLKAFHVW